MAKITKNQETQELKYLVIGAGGTGGCIGAYLTRAGKQVTLIARGGHLEEMKKSGLQLKTVSGDFSVSVEACTMEDYQESADVIFVCVKGYSLQDAADFIPKAAHKGTVVIPILNLYGTGKRLQESLPDLTVTDGCIYVAAEIERPGTILMSGDIFRVVYGLRKNTPSDVRKDVMPVLLKVKRDLEDSGITPILSEFIERDALAKFSYVSPVALVGVCHGCTAGEIQKEGEARADFASLIREIQFLSNAMGVGLPENIAERNLEILDHLAPGASASMQRDIAAGKQSEADGLVYEVLRLARKYQVEVPTYQRLSEKLTEILSRQAQSRNRPYQAV